MAGQKAIGWVLMTTAAFALAACENGFSLGNSSDTASEETAAAAPSGTTRLIERDVEAPKVFSVTEPALWDGRPSLGGVWVAYPGVTDPERVIIRNPANGKFVIGALFRRERENPGPKVQLSSDAAAALGMLAGQPAPIAVVALRREEVVEEVAGPARPILDSTETIATETLPPAAGTTATAPAAAAATTAATTAAAARPATRPAAQAATQPAAQTATAPATARATAAQPAAAGGRNLLQLGIFSVEANANRAAEQARKAGTTATVRRETSQGKTFWRVLVGPARDAADRTALLAKVKGLGYADAYFVAR